jgi:hypothetical protein
LGLGKLARCALPDEARQETCPLYCSRVDKILTTIYGISRLHVEAPGSGAD